MCDFATVGGVTVGELSVAFMLMRNPKVTPAAMANGLSEWFSKPVESDMVTSLRAGMIERSWVEPHPTRDGTYLVTETGERYAQNAFRGFVRLVDDGKRRFEVGLLWSLARAQRARRFRKLRRSRAMHRMIHAIITCSLLVGPIAPAIASPDTASVEDPVHDDAFYCAERKLGTWFYCSKPKPPEKRDVPPASAAPAQTAAERLDAVTAELRELKARAILDPSIENVVAYVKYQREQLDRSSMFSDVWQRAVWQKPELDYTLQRPVGTVAKMQWTQARTTERDMALAHLGRRYGLFYFFAQSCAACDVFSPILKSVADMHGITVRAISTDGGPSNTFRQYQVDSGQRLRMGITDKMTPEVVLFDTQTHQVIPVGSGVMAADELMERIFVLTQRQPGTDY